jgi:hypothetical protein
MKVHLLILAFAFHLKLINSKKTPSSLMESFQDVINSLFVKHQILFDVIIYKTESQNIFNIVDGIGTLLNGKISWTSEPFNLSQSTVIFTQNENNLNEIFLNTILENYFVKPLRFLIYVAEKFQFENLKIPIPNYDQGHIGHFSYFFVEERKEIQLLTLEWFTEKACHVQQTFLIDSFKKSNNKWKINFDIGVKFRNFHNCTLNIFSRIYNFETMYTLNLFDKQIKLQPFEAEMVQIIAVKGNFQPIFHWEVTGQSLDIYYLARNNVLNDDCQVTSRFWEDFITLNTSPAESYTSLEKMFLTFDSTTWLCLLVTISCAFLTILIVNQMPKKIQHLVFGENIKSPSLNLVGLFFGMGQTKLPSNDFAKILFVTYILFCLVISTAYHGQYIFKMSLFTFHVNFFRCVL